ncbi:hypothetical protein VRB95_11005 [Erwinia aphidicola]|uniref:hypothetical protein n=1 Tax=Erwinia aphidicola TaxID=68334 RepID=UPI0030CF5943
MIEKLRKLVVFFYVISIIGAAMFFSERDFRVIKYGTIEDCFPGLYVLISSIISIYFIGFYNPSEIDSRKDSLLTLWIKRRKLEEKKRISDIEK